MLRERGQFLNFVHNFSHGILQINVMKIDSSAEQMRPRLPLFQICVSLSSNRTVKFNDIDLAI